MFTRSNLRLPRKGRVVEMLTLCTIFLALLAALEACTKEESFIPEKTGFSKSAPVPAQLLVSGLEGTTGSAVGPDGFLYIPEGATGKISRVDPNNGTVSTFATGLPVMNPAIGIGGPIDVVFRNETAYALVTLVGADVGGSNVVGIYRIDGSNSYTVIADIGTFNLDNPPSTDFFIPTGLQYAIEAYRNGFLVTDGHLNRVLYVTLDGEISIVKSFDNIVPTGLALSGNVIYMAETGPTPHAPEDGKLVSFLPTSPKIKEVASGAPMIVDVEIGFPHKFYALSQGDWGGDFPGSPALPGTGSLLRVNHDGTFTTISEGLNLPTSLEFIDNTAYIVTLTGEVWRVEGIKGLFPK
jgi:hypothetical protein